MCDVIFEWSLILSYKLPTFQVPPISRPMSKVNRGQARVQPEEGHVRSGVHLEGQVRTPPHRRPGGQQHPRQPVLNPSEVYHPEPAPKRLPHPGPMHQGRPTHNPPPPRPDIKNLGRKFGGQISITSNETQAALNRRPQPVAGGSGSPKFRPELTAPSRSTPPQARPAPQASSNVPLPIPIQVKQEPGVFTGIGISFPQIQILELSR